MTLMQLREDVFQEKGGKMEVKVIMRRFTVKERGEKLSFCGFKNEKWLGGIENSTKWSLEIKNLSRGGGQNCLF